MRGEEIMATLLVTSEFKRTLIPSTRRRVPAFGPHSPTFPLQVIVCALLLLHLLMVASADGSGPGSVAPERRLSSRIVTTKYGALRGFVVTLPNRSLQPVEVFMGIPYASPPVGKLRFMPPVTPAHWSGVRSAHSPGSVCPQCLPDISNETLALQRMTPGRVNVLKRLLPTLQNQSEDCLYLNIFAPASVAKEPTRLPVIMFIHGESFGWNSGSSYDGSVLSSFSHLVVVTFNYRLGVLGFFPALDGSSRGNFGLMDQVAALHWLQENIGEFGGDPSNVTILGHGHGAACVNLLMLSPMARGLFHKAIMASGSALSPWAMATDAVGYSRKLAAAVGCPDDTDKNSIMVDCLRHKSAKELVSVDFKVPDHLTSLGPTVDGIVIPNDPGTLMAEYSSYFSNYPLLVGVTRVEYYHFNMLDERHGIDSSRRDRILRTLVRNLFTYHLQEIFLTISNEYTDWTTSSLHSTHIFEAIADLISDGTVVAPLIKTGLLHAKLQKNTYFYDFGYATEGGDYPSHIGCIHGEDLAYVFGAPLVPGMALGSFSSNYNRAEMPLSEMVMTYWSNFARTGNPNSNINSDGNGVSKSAEQRLERIPWPQFEEKLQQYLTITLKPKVRDHYHAHRLSYWLNLIPKLHVPGPASSSLEYHLLQDHYDLLSYEGIVRDTVSGPPNSLQTRRQQITIQSANEVQIDVPKNSVSTTPSNDTPTLVTSGSSSNPPAAATPASTSAPSSSLDKSALDRVVPNKNNNINASVSMMIQQGSYSTALSVTIAIGCSLLILNVLVFAGIFYQRDKTRLGQVPDLTKTRNFQGQNKLDEMNMTKNPSLNSPMKISSAAKQTPLYPGDYIASVTGQPSPMLSGGHSDQISPSPQPHPHPHPGANLYSNKSMSGHVSMVNSMYSTVPRGMTCQGLEPNNPKMSNPSAREPYEAYPRERERQSGQDLKI